MAGKLDLVEAVYQAVDGITRRQAEAIVEVIFQEIRKLLEKDERMTIRSFGSFTVHERPARRGRNSAEPIWIPARRSVGFRSQQGLRKAVGRPKNWAQEPEDYEMSPPRPGDQTRAWDPISEPHESESYSVVEVFFATDRKATRSADPGRRFGASRGDGSLAYGLCRVSIPEDHRVGRLEGPSWRRFEFREDPEKHVVLLEVDVCPGEAFFRDLATTLGEAPSNQILLFLHGFNVSFEDAARRTAQMAYDLQFQGVPAFYSWPSKGVLSAYTHDEATVEWTIPHLKGFLQDLADRSGADSIHLIAHSMGNRALTRALEDLAAVMADPSAPSFSEVILTAPDIDAGVFQQVAAAFRPAARRVTLYASERDRALRASYKFHGYPRAGDGGENIVVVPGIDTIDASAVDTDLVGHFYYGDNRSVLSDVFHLLRGGKPPGDRFGLRPRRCPAGRYWAFVP